MLTAVFAECLTKLEPGGRIAVNVANLGRRPYRSLSADVTDILQNRLRLLLRGEVLVGQGTGGRRLVRLGLVPAAGQPGAAGPDRADRALQQGPLRPSADPRQRHAQERPSTGTMFRDEFMEATTDVWEMAPES